MAEVEIMMYVALGFGAAALIALLLGRVMWNLAVGVGRRHAQRTTATPAVLQLQAERNRLRAENAMLARKVEVRLGELKSQVAEHMAEVSRSRNRVDRLSGEIDKRDAILEERDSHIARLKEHVGLLESELAARTGSLHELQHYSAGSGEADVPPVQQLAERDREIARLRAEVDRLAAAKSEAVTRERTVQQRLKGRIEDLAALSHQIEAQRRELAVQQSLRENAGKRRQPMRDPVEPDKAMPPDPANSGDEVHQAPTDSPVQHAERQASEVQSELDRLDEMWAKLAEVTRAVADEPGPGTGEAAGPDHETVTVNGSVGRPKAGEPAAAGPAPPRAEDEKKVPSGLANVISLAQRIRGLQRSGS